jgi:queuine tRNA-ribosyltransferase
MASPLEILARDPGSRARAGILRTAHGEIRTPAFVPLATKATVKGLTPGEVRDLGYDMVLGNTYHLFMEPGHELIKGLGGLHEFMRWDHPIITDSGGFQVFSMGHGTVADEIKGRASHGGERHGKTLGITEDGVRFRSHIDGSEKFLAPETSMEIQAALGSDIALVFDECTPFNVTKDYTARSTERTHRWLERCLDWHEHHGPPGQLVYGIVQGGVYEDLRKESAETIAASRVDGIAIGGSLGADKPQMYEVVEMATSVLPEAPPRHLLGIGDIDDLIRGTELGIDTFDCAMPTRLGRHGVALVPDPDKRWRVDLTAARFKDSDEPILDDCPCPTCEAGNTRGYLRYLLKNRELTGMRMMVVHNLAYVQRTMVRLRQAIMDGRLAEEAAALRGGLAP